MRFFDYIWTALKNFSRQKVRTFLTVMAITVGSLSLILMMSIIVGLRQSIIDAFKSMGAFNLVTVTRDPNATNDNPQLITASNNDPSQEEGRKIDDTTLAAVKKIPNVVDVTPIVSVWAKTIRLEGQDKKMWSNTMAYKPESNVFNLSLLAGRNLNSSDMDKIVVGTQFAQTYGYTGNPQELVGKKAILSYDGGGGSVPDWGPLPQKPPENADKDWWDSQQKKGINIEAEIVGVVDDRTTDNGQSYINIAWARRLMTNVYWKNDDEARKQCEINFQQEQEILKQQAASKQDAEKFDGGNSGCDSQASMKIFKEDNFTKNGYGSIIAKVNDEKNVEATGEAISKMGYGVTTAKNMIDQMNKIFTGISLLLGVIGGISLFVAAIGIINTMVMATFERIREIGVLRACGATRVTIRRIFMYEAAFLGFCGGVLGLIISIALAQIAKLLIKKFGADLGNLPLEHIGNFPWWLVIAVICFTTFVGLISGLYPAVKASRLNPVDAIRYE